MNIIRLLFQKTEEMEKQLAKAKEEFVETSILLQKSFAEQNVELFDMMQKRKMQIACQISELEQKLMLKDAIFF